MKTSQCGRIVQQFKPPTESRLIREYDTTQKFHGIHYDRVNELKNKYCHQMGLSQQMELSQQMGVNQQIGVNQTSCSPFQDLTPCSNIPDIIPLSAFIARQDSKFNDKEVRPKVKGHNLQQDYARKVELVNKGINFKLTNIEQELQLLKQQRMRAHQSRMREERQKIMDEPVSQIVRSKHKTMEMEIPFIQERSSRISKAQIVQKILKEEKEHKEQREVEQTKNLQILIDPVMVEESQCRLMEEVKQGKVFSHQFRTLIHRIKNQISLDYEFTQLVLTIPRLDLVEIKENIGKRHSLADLSFFQVSAMEMDPLQSVPTQPIRDISSTSEKLYQYYRKIQEHYLVKLHHKFKKDTVQSLFEEIGSDELTLGHLISYVNMQTGRQFRNRALVKLLRRMDICTHHIDKNRFYQSLCL